MKVRNPEQISISASNTTKDPGLTHSQIMRMFNLVKKTENMNLFEALWETLRNLFRSDKHSQAAARQILKDAFYFHNSDDYSKYFTGAVDGDARDKFTHWLINFNKLKEHAIDPENMYAKASLSPKDTLRVSFFIGDEAIFTLELQMKENTRTGCIDLSHAYFNGVVICGIDRLEVDLSNAEMNNSRWYD
ncbi:type III effector [Escherichia coli]|nr:T3SS effector EspY2 [Escherichia coli]UEO42781.1 type III effector [Escherichia coli]